MTIELNSMRKYGVFSPQEFWGVVDGLKPVSRAGIVDELVLNKEFKRQCEKNNLFVGIKELKGLYGQKIRVKMAYISKEKELIDSAASAEETGDRKKIASLLGYPECCSDFFIRYFSLSDPISVGGTRGITKKNLRFFKETLSARIKFFFQF